mmetsp:Transcript_26813/g.48323  ORF Transcript_26813/g.48323 Transcript_26813/m.48323 type:complete len:380 (-) Transcript_26813:926-2065(-)
MKNVKQLQEMVLAKARILNKQRLISPGSTKRNIELSLEKDIEEVTRRTIAEFNRKLSSSTKARSTEKFKEELKIRRIETRPKPALRNVQSANSRKDDKRLLLKQQKEAQEIELAQKLTLGWKKESREEWIAERRARLESEERARSRSRSIQNSFIDSRLAHRDESEDKEIEGRLERFNSKIERSTMRHRKVLQNVAEKAKSCATARDFASRRRVEEEERLLAYISKVKLRSKDERMKRAIAKEELAKVKRLKEGKLSQIKQRQQEDLQKRMTKAYEFDLSYEKSKLGKRNKHIVRERSSSVSTELKRLHSEDAKQRAECQHRAQLYKQERLLHKHMVDTKRVQMMKRHREERSMKRIEAQLKAREQLIRGVKFEDLLKV